MSAGIPSQIPNADRRLRTPRFGRSQGKSSRSRAGIHPRDGHSSRTVISFALQLSPAAGTIVGNDVFEHGGEGMCVDGFALADGNGAGGRVVAACGDDSLGIGDYGAVILEGFDMVLRRQQGGDVALENEVWTRSKGGRGGRAFMTFAKGRVIR
jgi:hypothetical protein